MNTKTSTSGSGHIKIYIPKAIKIFDNSKIIINKVLEGFIVKKSCIDDCRSTNFPKDNILYLSSINNDRYGDIEGNYTIEIEDEDTLKLIRIC